MDLVHRDAVGRVNSAGVELAAVAVVVAHLDRLVEAAPLIPTQRGLGYAGRIAGLEAEQRGVVHAARIDDLAGTHQTARVEPRFDLAERGREARTKKRRDPVGTRQP